MTKVNLLEDDRLGPGPASRDPDWQKQTTKRTPAPPPQRRLQPERKPPPETEQRPRPGHSRRAEPFPPSKKDTSSIYQGASLAILIFLIIIGIGVGVYFLYLQNIEDLSILGPAVPEETIPDEPGGFRPEESITSPPTQVAPETEFPVRIESDMSDIMRHISHGKKILDSSSRVFSQVNDQSFVRFFSISDEHLSLSALTRTPGFIDNIRGKIEATSIISDIPLFSSSDFSTTSNTWIELNVYANINGLSGQTEQDLQQVNLGEARRGYKRLIAVSGTQLQRWQTVQASSIDGWMRGLVFAQIQGDKSDILEILERLQNTDQNINISKVFVASAQMPPQFGDQFFLKLYATIYGQTTA